MDCGGALITPGLVECHSHIVFGGDRSKEWELKLAGASYEEVARWRRHCEHGGGTREATVEELVQSAVPRVRALMEEGVTTLEIKSGYGLNEEAERKMLVWAELGQMFPITVTTTYLGAHALPREYAGKKDEYIDGVIRILDILAEEGLVDAVDAFCDSIGYS